MAYEVIALDLDGTLTNSQKVITEPTRRGLIELQKSGKTVVLASGRPINGVVYLAEELELPRYGGYTLSFNGARITRCSDGAVIRNQTLPPEVIRPIWEYVKTIPGLDLISYTDTEILSGIQDNEFNLVEARNCRIDVVPVGDFPAALDFPVNKMIVSGEPALLQTVAGPLQEAYKGRLSIYFSEPFYLEIMPLNVDKAAALDFLLKTMGLTAENLICCGDSYNDISMIEYAGLGVAMANAQPVVKKAADLITASNDEDGVLRVIEKYMMQT